MSTQELLAEIKKLSLEERRQLLEALSRSLDEEVKAAAPDEERLEVELLQKMLAEGLISHIPEGISDEDDDFEPIEVMGKPVSETIIEERR